MAEGKRLGELARITGSSVHGNEDTVITGIASIEDAGPGDITFVADKKYLKLLSSSKASAVIMKEAKDVPPGMGALVAKSPQLAFARILGVLRPEPHPLPGISPGAEVSEKAVLGKNISVQANAVIADEARIGDNVIIYPRVYIGKGAEVGEDSILYPGSVVMDGCIIGKRVILHPNCVIGSDGFGYAREGARFIKIPQRGIVRLGDDVEVGACVTIDRATIGETSIGRGTKIDNLVQVAHNVKVGEDSVLVAQSGIAGSTKIGSRVQLGGQVGVSGHIEIADETMVGAKSGVIGNLKSGVYSGIPAMPHNEWLRAQAIIQKLPELNKRLSELEKRLKEIEGAQSE